NSDDGMQGGLGPVEWAEIAKHLAATGKLDYISCSQGTYLNRMMIYPTSPEEHGFQMAATRQVKASIDLPVVGVGRITTPDEAEAILRAGDCDFVGMTRALVADAFWVRKAEQGQAEKIRPCVGANWCMESIFAHAPIACIHNPSVGREKQLSEEQVVPAAQPRSIAVVGAGPAGLRAALTASRRGHKVALIERSSELGGQVAWMGRVHSARELADTAGWLIAQLRDTDVEIYRESEATVELITEAGYEAVIVATGATHLKHGWSPLQPARWDGPDMQGTDQPWVYACGDVLGAAQPLREGGGRRAVVVDMMGARQGVLTAEYLARAGWQVQFVTQLGQPAPNLAASRDWGKAYGSLRRMGVAFTTDHDLAGIGQHSVRFLDVYTKDPLEITGVDALVLINGAAAQNHLFHALRSVRKDLEVHLIGDALAPRRINDAIFEAELVARKI
ncbi:MAG: FAD-dependent oxidoreductase, partial [Comamonadaceae bacterium]|nr:FAD-dependent oxidoreductase [Comamonadaceae bacterium]